MPVIEAAQGAVGEIPVAGVEAKPLVNHQGAIAAALVGLGKENHLAAVSVAGPLVKEQHTGEVRQVFDLGEALLGEQVEDKYAAGLSGEARPELEPGKTFFPFSGMAHPQLGRAVNQIRSHVHHLGAGDRQAQRHRQPGSKHFIGQNADVLRVVLELGDVVGAVVTAQQMSLGAAAHGADVLEGASGHSCSASGAILTKDWPQRHREHRE